MKQTLKQALQVFCTTLTWLTRRRMRSREQLERLELSCFITVCHTGRLFNCLSDCALVAMVKFRVTKQEKGRISKPLCKCNENNRLKCVFCNSKLGYLATYGAISLS